jgi:hypothetical protein
MPRRRLSRVHNAPRQTAAAILPIIKPTETNSVLEVTKPYSVDKSEFIIARGRGALARASRGGDARTSRTRMAGRGGRPPLLSVRPRRAAAFELPPQACPVWAVHGRSPPLPRVDHAQKRQRVLLRELNFAWSQDRRPNTRPGRV